MPGRIFRIFIIFFGVIALLVLVGVVALHTPPVRNYARDRLVQELGARGVDAEIRNIGFSVIGPSVTLHDIVLRAGDAPDLPPFLEAERISLNLFLRDLVRGRVALEQASIRRPQVHIFTAEDGRSNLPPRVEDEPTVGLPLENFRITDGALRVENRAQGYGATLPEWRLAFVGDAREHTADISFQTRQPGQVSYQQRTLPVEIVSLEALVGAQAAELRQLTLAMLGAQVEASGTIQDFDNPVADLTGQARLSLEPLGRFAGLEEPAAGQVQGPFSATGPLDELRIGVDLRGEGLAFQAAQTLNVKADAVYLREAQRLRLESLQLNLPDAELSGNGEVALAEGERSSIDARLLRAELERLSRALDAPLTIASRASGNVNTSWPGLDFGQARTLASVNLQATRDLPAEDLLPVTGPVSVTYQGGRASVASDNLRALGATSRVRATVENGSLGGSVRGRTDDAGRLMSEVQAFLGAERPLVPMEVGGPLQFTAELGGTLEQMRVALGASSDSLRVGIVPKADFAGQAVYVPERLEIRQADLRYLGQTLSLTGTVGLEGPEGQLDLSASAEGVAVVALLAGMDRILPLPPGTTVQAHIGGTTVNPRVRLEDPGVELPPALGRLLDRR